MAHVNPYLTFDRNCEEAFAHYKSVIGGEYTAMIRFKDMPGPHTSASGDNDLVMHVALPIGNTLLMGSDRGDSMGKGTPGDNVSLAIGADSREHADKLYKGLSQGGKPEMPMGDAPWGDYFGMLVDQFGIQWMISFTPIPQS